MRVSGAMGGAAEVPAWLRLLPEAPEYRPTAAEFRDPIAYILKIEAEASRYGICKIVPPLQPLSRKSASGNLSRSFAARHPDGEPAFTTRQQQVGFCPRRPRAALKPVWQSGEWYTLPEFEAKAKQFERSYLKRRLLPGGGGGRKAQKKPLTSLETEAFFWKACAGRPFNVEYANDMPGSGFPPPGKVKRLGADNVGETAWNMRGVSRSDGSLLRFMKEDIPGVTSPMVYVAMMFSWFAWHAEDHDLHSLNYLHLGAGKTWYGAPRDVRLAFEDVIRVHGYGEEVNPLVTFANLGEKTTVMSPEVFITAGIPCCRLVQNAGEFVVTFPGAYHCGFSHGFNCGEAANIATPGWLKVAKEAAIRRASTNCPPLVSHFQLLYTLVLSSCLRAPNSISNEPRSSRLKDKMRGEGEAIIKDIFVKTVMENNSLLRVLLNKESHCIVLPHKTADSPSYSDSLLRSQVKAKPRLSAGLFSDEEEEEESRNLLLSDDTVDSFKIGRSCCSMDRAVFIREEKHPLTKCSKLNPADRHSSSDHIMYGDAHKEGIVHSNGSLDQGLLACVTCGILSFACVAVIQPSEAVARFFMSADISSFHDQSLISGEKSDIFDESNHRTQYCEQLSESCQMESCVLEIEQPNYSDHDKHSIEASDHGIKLLSEAVLEEKISALDLLASAYGNSSDSEEEKHIGVPVSIGKNDLEENMFRYERRKKSPTVYTSKNLLSDGYSSLDTKTQLNKMSCQNGVSDVSIRSLLILTNNKISTHVTEHAIDSYPDRRKNAICMDKPTPQKVSSHLCQENLLSNVPGVCLLSKHCEPTDCSFRGLCSHTAGDGIGCLNDSHKGNSESSLEHDVSAHSLFDLSSRNHTLVKQPRNFDSCARSFNLAEMQGCDKDSSRMHIFCLEHAVEVEKQLRPIGRVHIMLLCHPDYPKLEEEAMHLAEELEIDYQWKDIPFKEVSTEDHEKIKNALKDEEALPTNFDWSVKMGINLYYSANLNKSPLYSKQLAYNPIIYKMFSCNSKGFNQTKSKAYQSKAARQKKIVLAGKWCGKVWMSNQVHPILAYKRDNEGEDPEELHNQSHRKPVTAATSMNRSVIIRKSERKRKKPSRYFSALKNGSCISEDADDCSSEPSRKILRSESSSNKKVFTPHKRSRTNKNERCHSVPEDAVDESPEKCEMILCSRTSNRRKTISSRDLSFKDGDSGGSKKHLRNRDSVSKQFDSKPRIGKLKRNKRRMTCHATKKEEGNYTCNFEGCSMSFNTKHNLLLHKRNICPEEGCRKKLFSHKYMLQHQKVHVDDRPLKCPWKGCKMSFKWPWARTEHIRVHTGDRPYICGVRGCGQTFRFVSDFSRHKRKTGHTSTKRRKGG